MSVPGNNHSLARLYSQDRFSRIDETDDRLFYSRDRMVSHLDSRADQTVRDVIGGMIVEDRPRILDLMASWDSHLPDTLDPGRVVGLGLNENELKANQILDEYLIHDLNADPALPFGPAEFDAVINVVSVDYLIRPLEVFAEAARVLKPGGLFLVIFSNRWFESKVTEIWRTAGEIERVYMVQDWFRAGDLFGPERTFVSKGLPRPEDDKYAHLGLPSDSIYAVWAERKGGRPDRPSRPYPRAVEACDMSPDEKAGVKADPPGKLSCPHCGQRMLKWAVPQTPFTQWDNEFMFVCFNDLCPYLLKGYQAMSRQGNLGTSYRLMYNPKTGSQGPIMIQGLKMLRDGIIED